ncbi:MAG: hypothetical protein GY708_15680 [Actinomycetia bacterium]|nr:hypothetical protein [Actinomycetes bacterium]MCP4960703.1 hypothetical protein [Actinomycetes bacterium]
MSLRRYTLVGGLFGIVSLLLVGFSPRVAAQTDDPCLDNIPDEVPIEDLSLDPAKDGKGGTLPSVLGSGEVAGILAEVYARLPDADGDGFPDLPDDAEGNPDFDALDRLLGEPGVRDISPGENSNVVTIDEDGAVTIQATDALVQQAETQVRRSGCDPGLIAGSGSALSGPCMGMAWSYDKNGLPLDQAADWSFANAPVDLFGDGAGSQAFTSSNPFRVDANGFVIYTGVAGGLELGSGPRDHDWFLQLKLFGTGTTLDAGGDPNGAGENRNAGAVNLRDDLPAAAKINAVLGANGQMEAEGGDFRCVGSGFVDLSGDLDPTLPGVALAAIAAIGLLFNARPALTWGGSK